MRERERMEVRETEEEKSVGGCWGLGRGILPASRKRHFKDEKKNELKAGTLRVRRAAAR